MTSAAPVRPQVGSDELVATLDVIIECFPTEVTPYAKVPLPAPRYHPVPACCDAARPVQRPALIASFVRRAYASAWQSPLSASPRCPRFPPAAARGRFTRITAPLYPGRGAGVGGGRDRGELFARGVAVLHGHRNPARLHQRAGSAPRRLS